LLFILSRPLPALILTSAPSIFLNLIGPFFITVMIGAWPDNIVSSPSSAFMLSETASPEYNSFSRDKMFNLKLLLCIGPCDRFFYTANHVKILLAQFVIFTFYDAAKTFDRVFKLYVFAGDLGKILGHKERLR